MTGVCFRPLFFSLSSTARALFFVLLLGLSACDSRDGEEKKEQSRSEMTALTPDQVALNNRGVAEMGRFEYAKAAQTFATLLQDRPDVLLFRLNHVIAVLNRQNPGDEDTALQMAEELAQAYPDNLQAPYIAGLLHFNAGRCDRAVPYFQRVIQGDPQDAHALYFAGQCLLQQGQAEAALEYFTQAIDADSYLRSAYYSGFMAARQTGKIDEAEQLLATYQKLQANPQSRLAEIKYTRMGEKAEARPVVDKTTGEPARLLGNPPYFDSWREYVLDLGEAASHAILAVNPVDFELQGHVDLAVLTPHAVYRLAFPGENQKESSPAMVKRLIGFSQPEGFHAMAWGDINNDGQLDVLLIGAQSQVWLGQDGQFQKAWLGEFGLPDSSWRDARLADADHDGDLDMLVITHDRRFELWNNDLNGQWRVLNHEKLIPEIKGVRQIQLVDVDADRDVDIVLRLENGLVWLQNDRMWRYSSHSLDIEPEPLALSVGDVDNNGVPDWLVLSKGRLMRLAWNPVTGRVEKLAETRVPETAATFQLADVNGNGRREVIVLAQNSIQVLDGTKHRLLEEHKFPLSMDPKALPVLVHGLQGPVMWWFSAKGQAFHLPPSQSRAPFVLLSFTGDEDKANAVRSNKSGLGVRFDLHAGGCVSAGTNWQNFSTLGQDYQPVSAACDASVLDYIAIQWPDGVFQTERPLYAGRHYHIKETQRQLSSCPVIFLKRGGEYHFESDVLGVGGIGFAVGRDEYAQPRPWENYLVEAQDWEPDNGRYSLLFTEPMEEAAYLDALEVTVIDIPDQWRVVLDERMQTGPPEVTGAPVFYRFRLNPLSITRSDGLDVTDLGLRGDGQAIEPAGFDARFLGFADGEQSLVLDFGAIPEGDWVLLMRGWVEYGYSQTGFAAWQAGLRWQPPSIDIYRDGQWHELLHEAGYPAGMPRLASIPLGQGVSGAEKIRIRSNQELYFDELALVRREQPEIIREHHLPLAGARLFKLGFPKREDGPQRRPDYDFSQRQPFWDTRYMKGNYTRLGSVDRLIEKADNALAIIGPGEAIEIQFEATEPPLETGWRRYFVLSFTGWAKDMDLMTKDGDTLAPIPHHGPVSESAKQLNQKYNVRFQHGR